MYTKSILQTQVETVTINQKFDYLKQREGVQESGQKQDMSQWLSISDIAISLSPLGFVIVWAVFLLILQKIRSALEERVSLTVKGVSQVPCKNCKFFSNNHYLKCAVKPDIVLTEAAIDCSEYCPKKTKFTPRRFFR
ncbi:hypothetical protein [Cylindrospermopsis curvispora]|uniref:Uncharacterized protein n=1 Tax=Cylindrospermopsis curvispora GIHE-G1 TaxID=2666332 RepID=A0A7H0EXP9_9CYAN|nr:hypothetical protein [Cylindrospermopsis curvispora]QNP28565.1 hypothetical protein IAR63_11680 [Cylindrospermopsis curvispora GIHE-G1]